MKPTNFPEANKRYGPPSHLEESQCGAIHTFEGQVTTGSVDGEKQVVVAWLPSDEEVDRIVSGEPIFITMLGGLAPHFLSTSFQEAINPA